MSRLISLLVMETGLGEQDVRSIIATAPSRYKTYSIPKRRGGERIISQPAYELKIIQRVLSQEVVSRLPVHDAAMAYRKGKSIRDNATAHVNGNCVLKFDFTEFFPSIVSTDWTRYCARNKVFEDEEDIRLSANILFHRARYGSVLRLAIGAPSSPGLSNALMFDFDSRISEAVAADKVAYTRYADDLTFSARRVGNLSGVGRMLRQIVKEIDTPRLRINEEKTVLATKKVRRMVTGLVLADDGLVSLGRDRKREIRAALHRYMVGGLDVAARAQLAGRLAFVNSVEPSFLMRLSRRYGQDSIERLKAFLPPPTAP